MSEGNDPPSGSADLPRAGRVLASAVLTPSGARWARSRRRGLGSVALGAALVLGGAVAAYAAMGGIGGTPPGSRVATESIVRAYILDHPEIISEAMKRLEDKRIAALVDQNRPQLETPYAGAWEGAAKPDVTLVAFMDYACGYCRASLPDIQRLLREDPGLRIVYHELPIITQGSVPAARVSLYAAEAGKFRAFHQAMYAQGGVAPAQILAAAAKAGLDPGRAKAELANPARDPMLSGTVALARTLEAQGTPLFVVGNQMFYGAIGYERLKEAVDKARRAG